MAGLLAKTYQRSKTQGIVLKDKGPKISELPPKFIAKYEKQQEQLRDYYRANPQKIKELN
ncbi:hypothetical protein [Paenisporosarcina sp. TG20]|uniref:hypothetical protein n=1 Tax=Paenisporosarcina sp. TG20 TaxID=1211706 RepID=UPI0003023F46|nr:hypothetical protein [Paenisporosarcina sp. TG20]